MNRRPDNGGPPAPLQILGPPARRERRREVAIRLALALILLAVLAAVLYGLGVIG